ncbi:MAG: hypothetical protein WDZ86_06770 [Gammaproteobacteria bacterium]
MALKGTTLIHKRTQSGSRLHESGQSMVEFTIVVVFFCLVLTSDPALNVMRELNNVMKERFEHYSYTVSLSDYPDASTLAELEAMLRAQLEAQGYSNEDIDAMLDGITTSPDEWIDSIEDFVGKGFPDAGEFPEIDPGDFL